MKTLLAFFLLFAGTVTVTTAQWSQLNSPTKSIKSFTVAGTTLFAVGEGVYRSRDYGTTWKELSKSSNIIAASGDVVYLTASSGVSKSTDFGDHWSPVGKPGFANSRVIALAANTPNIVDCLEEGSFISSDDGANWKAGTFLFGPYLSYITVNDGVFYAFAATVPFQTFSSIVRSDDNGATWVNCDLKKQVISIAVAGQTLFASTTEGVFRSDNKGNSWVSANSGLENLMVNGIVNAGSIFFATTYQNGIYKSVDNGAHWIKVIDEIKQINAITTVGTTIFIGTESEGIFRTTNFGGTWEQLSIPNQIISSLGICGKSLFAASKDKGIYASFDKGASWHSDGLQSQDVKTIASVGEFIFASTQQGLFRSNEKGGSWLKLKVSDTLVTVLFSIASQLFAATIDGKLYSSEDFGDNWKPLGTGISAQNISSLWGDKDILYAGVSTGKLYRSNDKGGNWTELNTNWGNSAGKVTAIVSDGASIYATNSLGIYKSADGGVEWKAVNYGLTNKNITTLVHYGTTLFAGTYAGEIFRSTDNANSWTPVSPVFTTRSINSIIMLDDIVFVGTDGNSIFKLENVNSAEEDLNPNVSLRNSEFTVYPNPATSEISIHRKNNGTACDIPVNYSIYNVLGVKLIEIESDLEIVNLSIGNLPKGLYTITASGQGLDCSSTTFVSLHED